MRALKTIIIVMTILIAGGLGLLVYGLVTKVSGSSEQDAAVSTDTTTTPETGIAASLVHTPFGTVETVLPPKGRVVEMAMDRGRIVIRVETPDGGQSLMVFDLKSGASLGVIRIEAAK